MKAIITVLSVILFISLGVNVWQYYHPRIQKLPSIIVAADDKPDTKITVLKGGNQSATAPIRKDYNQQLAGAKKLIQIVKSIPDLENEKKIVQLTEAKAVLELQLSQKDLVLNDIQSQVKQWKDKYNMVRVNNSTNEVKVNSEVSPKYAVTEKRDHFLSPKVPYTTITSENPAIRFYGLESYTFKNPDSKNFLELNLLMQGYYFDGKIYPVGGAELLFNPDGRLRPFGGYGYFYNDGKLQPIVNVGLKVNLLKL